MKRLPITATIMVALAVATMIGLGIWQLQRKSQKEALLVKFAVNANKPAIGYPALGPVSDDSMFRRSSVVCLRVTSWKETSGSDAKGNAGLRFMADCVTGAEGPGAIIVAGVGDKTGQHGSFTGGSVSGIITTEPDHRTLIAKLFGKAVVLRPMLVSANGLGGLRAPQPPSIKSIPNDHLLYAIQWFFFAGAALVIYVLALRKKMAGQQGPAT